jgi:hypothetical protein
LGHRCAISAAKAVPVSSGMDSSVKTISKRCGESRNARSAAMLEVNPTGS